VQAAADWVTDTNNRDGVAIAIERLQATGWL
jgi:hydroxymethylpyrimidine pyrophosphatase-like HAD family hydrolase